MKLTILGSGTAALVLERDENQHLNNEQYLYLNRKVYK